MSARESAGGSASGAEQSEEIADLGNTVSTRTADESADAADRRLGTQEEESSDAEGGDAGRASEDIAAASAGRVGAPQTRSAQDDTYLREHFGESDLERTTQRRSRGLCP